MLITAQNIRLVAEDGSFIKIGGGITMGSNSALQVHTASHDFLGPSTQQADRPSFGKDGTAQQFLLHYPGHTEAVPHIAANQHYKITMDDGRVVQGITDAKGMTEKLTGDVMHIAKLDILKPSL